MIVPVRLPGWLAVLTRVDLDLLAAGLGEDLGQLGELFRLMAKLASVRSIGSWLS